MRGTSFQELADQIRDMQALREKVHASAFSTLERLAPALVRLLLEDLRTPERAAQAERLAELVRRTASSNDALVVCGDFNVEPGSRTFEILGQLGLVDLVTTRGFESTRTSHYAKPGRFADYLLVNERVAVADFTVVKEPEVSDHCPLVLEL